MTAQAEHGNGANVGFALHGIHGNFNGHRHEPLNFFGRSAIPFGHDDDLGIGDVGKGFEGVFR